METCFLENIQLFADDAVAYSTWINIGMLMRCAGFNAPTFIEFSKLNSASFNEQGCHKKLDSFTDYELDSKLMKFYLKEKGSLLESSSWWKKSKVNWN